MAAFVDIVGTNNESLVRTFILAFAFIFVASAAQAQTDTASLVWPPKPERPRIKFLSTVSSLKSFKGEEGFFSKVLGFFFGGESNSQWLVQPVGIAISKKDVMYVADPGARGVHIINQTDKKYKFIGGTKFGFFVSPVGIALAPDGTVYVSDSQSGCVVAGSDDLDGKFIIKDHLMRPTGLSVINRKLYVVDTGLHKIVIFDLDGHYIGEFGKRGEGDGEFNYPVHIAGKDTTYVVDAMNYRIEKFTPTNNFVSQFGSQGSVTGRFASPKSAALDSDGDLYVTDALMDNFQIFNSRGELLLVVGHQGEEIGEFMSPNGICIDSQDRIYVVDGLNRRIQIFQYLK
jgi:DNA-binding beta-propeller fold protein YncE